MSSVCRPYVKYNKIGKSKREMKRNEYLAESVSESRTSNAGTDYDDVGVVSSGSAFSVNGGCGCVYRGRTNFLIEEEKSVDQNKPQQYGSQDGT